VRHQRKGRKLGRDPAHRKALHSNMCGALFHHGRIQTTEAKAKELRPIAEKLITLARKDPTDVAAQRHAVAFLRYISANPDALRALVTPPPQLARVPPQWRAKAHIDHLVTEFRRLEGRLAYEQSLTASDTAGSSAPQSSVSSAPPPPPTLGKAGRSTDPVRSALARNDFAAFDQAEMEKRRRQRTGGRAG